MKIRDILKSNSYPGRGIIIGKHEEKAVIAYFIMGRSENSRNRVFRKEENEIKIYPFDESKVEDPSLIIYSPVRSYENRLIVTNGDQTDTVYNYLKSGKSFEEALNTRCFEPDAPNFTPRISGMVSFEKVGFTYKMSILKSADSKGAACSRYTFCYEPLNNTGHFIHTYVHDGNPIPAFTGEPEKIEISDEIDSFTKEIWDNLNEQNKVSLYVRYTTSDGSYEDRLINKLEGLG